MMRIKHDYQRDYTETFTRTVGPTTRLSARGVIPTKPTDLTGIFIAPNGNDTTGTGIEANPVRTLGKANTLLSGLLATAWFFRNGSNDDMTFTETAGITLAGNTLAVEDGEIATLDYTSSTTGALTKPLAGPLTMNGLSFRTANSPILRITTGSTSNTNIENCRFEDIGKLSIGVISYQAAIRGSTGDWDADNVHIRYCYFTTPQGISVTTNVELVVFNSIFAYKRLFGAPIPVHYGVQIYGTSGNKTKTIKRCIFTNYINNSLEDNTSIIAPIQFELGAFFSVVNPGPTINMESTHFYNSNSVFIWSDQDASAGKTFDYADITLENNNYSGNTILQYTNTGPSSFAIVNTDEIDGNTPPMFHDESDAVNSENVESFRLQRIGQATPDESGKYFINSPHIDAGKSGDDLNPFDESIALATEGFNETLDIDWPPSLFNLIILHSNPANLRDVNGNLSRTFDAKRRQFVFTFGDGTHISNLQLKKIAAMLSDNGTKKLYPMGESVNLFEEDISSTGIFLDTENSIAPTVAGGVPMVPNWWQGFWINIAGDEFYIESNDATKMYLVDKLGIGFPSNGLETFIIESILVNAEAAPYSIHQNNFTSFREGGFLREDPDDNIRPFDYTIESITLEEIEDITENV